MEGVHDRDRVGQFLGRGGLEAGEPVHRDHLHGGTPCLVAASEPGLERLLGAALDHVEQPGRAGAVTDAGEVDDHGDVLVAPAGVAPHVLIDPDDLHPLEPAGVVDEDPLALGEDGVVGGVPGDPQALGDPGDGQVPDHDALQRPPQPTTRQLRSRLGRPAGVLAPHVATTRAPVAADRDQQRGRSPAQRLVGQPPGHRVPRRALAPAATTPLVGFDDPARQNGPLAVEALPRDFKSELVEPAEGGQIRAAEAGRRGSVAHVEVFRMGSVRTSILGRPRRLLRDRRASTIYTVNCEEPVSRECHKGLGGPFNKTPQAPDLEEHRGEAVSEGRLATYAHDSINCDGLSLGDQGTSTP